MRTGPVPIQVEAALAASAPSAPVPPLPTRTSYSDPEAEVLPWTGLSLLVALSGLFLLIAFPGSERAEASDQALDPSQELEVVTALAELRRAIVAYRTDEGAWPGARLGSRPLSDSSASDQAWQVWFERNLAGQRSPGESGSLLLESLEPLAAYLPGGGVPVNVVNGLRSVRVLLSGEPMPEQPDGRSGWILDPRTGDLRVNALGRLRDSGRKLFDL